MFQITQILHTLDGRDLTVVKPQIAQLRAGKGRRGVREVRAQVAAEDDQILEILYPVQILQRLCVDLQIPQSRERAEHLEQVFKA